MPGADLVSAPRSLAPEDPAPVTGRRAARHRLVVLLLCGLALLRGVLLAGLIPPMHGTDEPAHWDYVQRIAEAGRLPELRVHCAPLASAETRELRRAFMDGIAFHPERSAPPLEALAPVDPGNPEPRSTAGCGPDALYPPLYFATAAVGYRAAYGAPVLRRLFAGRLASVAWGALSVAFAYMLGACWFEDRRGGTLLALVFLVQPTLAFLSAVVTNDAALFACSTAAFAAVAWARRRPERVGPLILLAAASCAATLVKPTANLILPVLAACTVAALGPSRPRSWGATLAALAPAAAAAWAWSILDRSAMDDMIAHAARPPMPVGEYLATAVLDGHRMFEWFRQYWSVWGWMDTFVREAYYRALALCVGAAAAGALLGWRSLARHERWAVALAAASTAFVVAALFVLDYHVLSWQGLAFIQGRYLLPLLPLHALALVIGLRSLGRWGGARVDGAWTLPALLAIVNGAAVLRALARYYS
jgi:hypothetical protein